MNYEREDELIHKDIDKQQEQEAEIVKTFYKMKLNNHWSFNHTLSEMSAMFKK